MTERSQLHKDLIKIKRKGNYYVKDILDFIIADRKRTIEEYKIVYFCDCDKNLPEQGDRK